MNRRPWAVVALLAVTACGANTSGPTQAAPGQAAAPAAPTAGAATPTSGPLAFSLAKIGGGNVDGGAYVGKPTAFWFWSPN